MSSCTEDRRRHIRRCSKPSSLLAKRSWAETDINENKIGLSDRWWCHGVVSLRNWCIYASICAGFLYLLSEELEGCSKNLLSTFQFLNALNRNVFSLRRVGWTLNITCLELLEPLVNRSRLGRAHLGLECFPGLGSKASRLLNNNVFFPCCSMYLFYRSLVLFIHLYPLGNHSPVMQEWWFKNCEDFLLRHATVYQSILKSWWENGSKE